MIVFPDLFLISIKNKKSLSVPKLLVCQQTNIRDGMSLPLLCGRRKDVARNPVTTLLHDLTCGDWCWVAPGLHTGGNSDAI